MSETGEAEERVYFSENDVLVTGARLLVRGKSYFVKHITSVSVGKRKAPTGSGMLVLAILWMLSFFGSFAVFSPEYRLWGCISGVVFLAVVAWYVYRTAQCVVRITAASGEHDVLVTPDEAFAKNVCRAIEEAVASC